jgi:hypothetical protein
MENNSILFEHTLLTSGDVADLGVAYAGWPAKRLENTFQEAGQGGSCPTLIPNMSNLSTFSEKQHH